MKYKDLKNEIRDLGFEDDSIFLEYVFVIPSAITRACRLIASTIKAPTGQIDLKLKPSRGITTTPISIGSTTNPITIKGESVTVSKWDVVQYDYVDNEGQYPVQKSEFFYFDGSAWQVVGRYDLEELSKDENGNVLFDSVDTVVLNDKPYLDYDIEDYHIMVLPHFTDVELTVYYNERIIPVTNSTQEDFDIQVVYPCEPLVALLAAHYVWLDDDERKAILYWNEYDQLKQEIMDKVYKIKARVVGGI